MATFKKGVRFRIYPNNKQKTHITNTLGCCRLVYNKMKALRDGTYKNTGKGISYNQTSKELTILKHTDEFAFLNEVSGVALQQSLRDLDRAYTNFFKRLGGYPKFKSKHDSWQSYRVVNQDDKIRIVGKYIKIPVLGMVRVKQSMNIDNINNVTIEVSPTGKYYVVVNTDFEPELRPNDGCMVGIDVGIKTFITDSNNKDVENPKWLTRMQRKLRREQRKLSRMIEANISGYAKGPKGGRVPVYKKPLNECTNIQKQRKLIARLQEKVTNQRNDFEQKLSTKLVKENQLIGIEDLNIKGMVRNHKLARAISDASWSKFIDMLEYKATWYGCEVIKVPRFYASSQTCSCCGYKNPKVKNLTVRKWTCPECNTIHLRDHTAAVNILNKALEIRNAHTA